MDVEIVTHNYDGYNNAKFSATTMSIFGEEVVFSWHGMSRIFKRHEIVNLTVRESPPEEKGWLRPFLDLVALSLFTRWADKAPLLSHESDDDSEYRTLDGYMDGEYWVCDVCSTPIRISDNPHLSFTTFLQHFFQE